MANGPQEKVGFNWPPRRLSVMQRRVLVLASLFLLAFSVTAFIKVVTFETVQLERRALVERQFQLGGFLGAVFRDVIGTKAIETTAVTHSAKQELAASLPTPNHVTETSTATSSMPETSDIQINETPGSNLPLGDPAKLLEALTDAVKEAIIASEQPLSTVPKHNRKSSLSDIIVRQSNSVPLSADSSFSAFLQISRPTSMGNLPTPSVRLLGGFWGDSLTLRVHDVRAIAEDPPSDSSTHSPSFLSDVSDIVAEISDIDLVAAAKLTDTVLDALHVDSSAIASAIPKVLNQASISAADLLPLVIPAVAKAMNQPLPLPQLPSVSSLDMVETLNKVLQQGTTVINDLSRAMEDITDPALLAVLNQLAMIVSAVANYLNKPLCAVEQVVDGTSFEEVIPCHSAETESLTLVGQLTTLATSVLPGSPLRTSGSGGSTTLAPPNPYSSSENQASPPNPDPPSTSAAGNPTKTSNPAPTNGENGGHSMPNSNAETSSTHPSCPTCPSCDQCPQKICSIKGPESPSIHHPPDPSVGPCPGKGYKCDECLDGWFCPPQETPAQVVPCGVGWPCYHCSTGWFCAPKETPGPTPPISSGTSGPITSGDAAPTKPPQSDDLPTDWSHLGCFQDAISRTLLGARPVDYLQGDVSSKECVDHCISRGYKFAGTENGRECWCGSSIRDDAVRLPESQCGKPCQGQPTETCGGSWAIDVFLCSMKAESPSGPPGKAAGGFMYQLLSNFKGSNRKTNSQLVHAVA